MLYYVQIKSSEVADIPAHDRSASMYKAKLSDLNLGKEVARNPYYQYFIGLESYRTKCPFGHGVLPELRKRFGMDFINEIKEVVVGNANPTAEHADDKREEPSASGRRALAAVAPAQSPHLRQNQAYNGQTLY